MNPRSPPEAHLPPLPPAIVAAGPHLISLQINLPYSWEGGWFNYICLVPFVTVVSKSSSVLTLSQPTPALTQFPHQKDRACSSPCPVLCHQASYSASHAGLLIPTTHAEDKAQARQDEICSNQGGLCWSPKNKLTIPSGCAWHKGCLLKDTRHSESL